jgi:hypothetical protein
MLAYTKTETTVSAVFASSVVCLLRCIMDYYDYACACGLGLGWWYSDYDYDYSLQQATGDRKSHATHATACGTKVSGLLRKGDCKGILRRA